jgi:hypothetical protein
MGRAIAQAVSSRFPTAVTQVRCQDLWWTKWHWVAGCHQSNSVPPSDSHSTECFTFIIIYHPGMVTIGQTVADVLSGLSLSPTRISWVPFTVLNAQDDAQCYVFTTQLHSNFLPSISLSCNWPSSKRFSTKTLYELIFPLSTTWHRRFYPAPFYRLVNNSRRSRRPAARSKARNVFIHSNTPIIVSNPSRGMDVCIRLFCVCVVLCVGSGLATGLIPRPRSPTDCVEDSKFRIN